MPSTKSTKKIISAKKIKEAPPEQCFWVNNGPICKNPKELKEAIQTMSEDQYAYHTQQGNDFANWMKDVMGDRACAEKLLKAKTKGGAARAFTAYK